MRYRGGNDRQVSLYIAALMIAIFGGGMTLIIVRAITEVDFVSLTTVSG